MSEWAVETGVTCVVCPKCGFTFDASHTDDTPEGGYSCPNCNEGTNTMGIHNGEIVIDRLGSIDRSLLRAREGVERELAHRKTNEGYTSTYLSQLNDLARQAAALEDKIAQTLNFA